MNKKIVLCPGLRTPIGQLAKSFSQILPEDLLQYTVENLLKKTNLKKESIDGMIIGWTGQSSHAPNIARIAGLKAGLSESIQAVTLQANCVSGIEAISSAARRIALGEGECYIAGGTESMSSMPFIMRGDRQHKALRTLDTLYKNWDTLPADPAIKILDSIEEGLTDPVKRISMAQTAELCAQKFNISRAEQDQYTHQTLSRCAEGVDSGFYKNHVVPLKIKGEQILEKDEYIQLRRGLIDKPQMIKKAPPLFQNSTYPFSRFYQDFGYLMGEKKYQEGVTQPTVTLFNACPRSDAAVAIIVTSEEKAQELGLEIMAEIKSWAFTGVDPAFMGIGPAYAAPIALKNAGLSFNDLDQIELHEAFAATVLSVFYIGEKEFNHSWKKMWKEKKLNPNGGSMGLGHPLAATGTRLLLNLIDALKANRPSRFGLVAACASGGLGGAMIIEKKR
ncbi:MAG: thiolase family protein [Spirochaetes bacterium]|nr:thiolase family protein [Spirochaetota bacterium]